MATKHKADEVNDRVPGISAISGIKPEPSDDDTDRCDVDSKEPIEMSELESPTTSGNVEQVFIKKEDDPDAGGIASISIKSEPPGDEWDKCIAEDKSILEMETENYKLDLEMSGKVKPELLIKKEWDNDPAAVYEVSASRIKKDADELEAGPAGGVKEEADMEDDEDYQLTEDCDIKSESGASMDAASDVPSNSMGKSRKRRRVVNGKVGRKSFEFYDFNYSAFSKHRLIGHMDVHDNSNYVHDLTKSNDNNSNASGSSKDHKLVTCLHCQTIFKSKTTLDDHVIKKHPEFISQVTSKIHECTKCFYKTTFTHNLNRHMSQHPEAASSCKLSTCIHCNSTFKCKASLDKHIMGKHPEFMASVTSKLHECTKCTFKTVVKSALDRHLLEHPELSSDFKHSICIHCNATFREKRSLGNHMLREHPGFVTTVTSKLHECTKCTFKTVVKTDFDKHLLKHPEVASDFKLLTCIHCEAPFKEKRYLDDHVVRKHPEFITTVEKEIYYCTKCTYRTTLKNCFETHMLVHTSSQLITCIQCNATFKSKASLNRHVVRKHFS